MPPVRSIRYRRRRKKISAGPFDLNLTAMLDVMVIILVFLLKSYAATTSSFTNVPGLDLPVSASPDVPADSLQVIITPEAITFEEKRIVDFVQEAELSDTDQARYRFKRGDLDEGGLRILPLYDELVRAKEKSELLRSKSRFRDEEGQPLPFDGVLAVQADKRVSYNTIRRVMYTAGSAGYKLFRFLAVSQQ